MSYGGAGSARGSSCGSLYLHNLSSYECCNSYVGHVGGRRGGALTPEPSVSLARRDIRHLHGWTDNCCELQNASAWLFYLDQRPFQIPDWLIPLANPKPSKTCAARVGAPKWKPLAKLFSWKRREEVRRMWREVGGGYIRHFICIYSALEMITSRGNSKK